MLSWGLVCGRFRPVIVKEAIHHVLVEHLHGVQYSGEVCTEMTRKISDEIKVKLKGNNCSNRSESGARFADNTKNREIKKWKFCFSEFLLFQFPIFRYCQVCGTLRFRPRKAENAVQKSQSVGCGGGCDHPSSLFCPGGSI